MNLLDTLLPIVGWSTFALIVVCGLFLNALGLFGNWLILGAVCVAYIATDFMVFGPWVLVIMLLLAIAGEVLEFVMAGYGAKRFGGSKGSMWAALVGCILGAIAGSPLLPIIGTVIGACFGAFVAAALWEFLHHEKEIRDSLWTGFGAGMGKIGGIAVKFGCGVAIVITGAISLFL